MKKFAASRIFAQFRSLRTAHSIFAKCCDFASSPRTFLQNIPRVLDTGLRRGCFSRIRGFWQPKVEASHSKRAKASAVFAQAGRLANAERFFNFNYFKNLFNTKVLNLRHEAGRPAPFSKLAEQSHAPRRAYKYVNINV